ncbi:hypothetical protein JRO89_XS02G0014200 [Xanthoceras sorbifolium]|uniref:Protein kinase domain-containing protein n=1 Tax=Xanthoceras sorbifolium TaxID=99658 RepID=A0ABQ8IDT5_9ROSI|nr:hypothetical protein JRO89_XS02G0014200 [Xanthoceras sorbifolium]
MGFKTGKTGVDLWSEIADSDEQKKETKFEVIYRRRLAQQTHKDVVLNPVGSSDANRLSLAAAAANIDKKRISWNRSLSTSLKVCQGPYDDLLVKAWEDWDDRQHGSENDHPKQFPENQCYVVFVLQRGGKDLESFVLLNFDEARSSLVQVRAALAVAEAAYEFEHRDLHWGNILLSRNDSVSLHFILEGKHMSVRMLTW